MEITLFGLAFAAGLGLALIVALLIWRRGAITASPPSGEPRPALRINLASVPPEAVAAARTFLSKGNKIEAIKQVREATGWGLKEAKDFVESLPSGPPVGESIPTGPTSLASFDMPPAFEAEIRSLLAQGNMIEAVKRVRVASGADLRTAKDIVDGFGARAPRMAGTDEPPVGPEPPVLTIKLEAEARALAREGRLIEAIRLVRERTGWGLKEAKDYVEGIK